MSAPPEQMQELRHVCANAHEMAEGDIVYLHLPVLKLPSNLGVVEALLCPQAHSGYATRLFLSASFPQKAANWTTHTILSRTWYTWSWKDVPANQRLAEILAQHLVALR